MDGLIPVTADALYGDSRLHADVGGCLVPPRPARMLREGPFAPALLGQAGSGARRRGHPGAPPAAAVCAGRQPGRIRLVAPARWKSARSVARSQRVDWATLAPAPAQWPRPRPTPTRSLANAPPAPAQVWLLPPSWPLDGWRAIAVAGVRRRVDRQLVPRIRQYMASWTGWASAHRRRLAAGGLAIGALAGAMLLLLRMGLPHPDARSTPVTAMVGAASIQAPVARAAAVRAASLPPRPPARAAALPASAPTTFAEVRHAPAVTSRSLLSDVSTMDLMMPIAEPDLDITSRKSLWSQVGKAAGVDPLLLYSVALVESKSLYPDGRVAPTPWLFRVNDHLVRGERHDVQLAMAAATQFGSAVQDVGIMQVYYPMHRDAVRDPLTLLNPRTNITVAAKILREGMHQTRDRVLGVGYYHSHTPSLARDYGAAVLTVYQRLKATHRTAGRRRVMAR